MPLTILPETRFIIEEINQAIHLHTVSRFDHTMYDCTYPSQAKAAIMQNESLFHHCIEFASSAQNERKIIARIWFVET